MATVAEQGSPDLVFELASVTKILTALTCWIAVEEGTVSWTDEVGPPGATFADLLSHSSGMSPDSQNALAAPRTRRIYSNAGFEAAAGAVQAAAGMPFATYFKEAVRDPLGLATTELYGSPAYGGRSTLGDLLAVARELLEPTLIDATTLALVTAPAQPNLDGVLPGYGAQRPNPWGLGVEIKGSKSPHWTGATHPATTFGHFGRTGTLLWVDPSVDAAGVVLGDHDFGPWAVKVWPAANDALRVIVDDA